MAPQSAPAAGTTNIKAHKTENIVSTQLLISSVFVPLP